MGLISLVNILFSGLTLLIVIRALLSWFPVLDHPAVALVHRLTDPILNPVRRLIPPVGGLDLSPFIAILLLTVLQRIVVDVLVNVMLAR